MNELQQYALVALGGAAGSCLRFALGRLLSARWGSSFPWGTFTINVTGCLVLGFFLVHAVGRSTLDPRWRLLVAVGFCGGYTTFSTFAVEGLALIEAQRWLHALLYSAGSVVAGLLAAACGAWLGRRWP